MKVASVIILRVFNVGLMFNIPVSLRQFYFSPLVVIECWAHPQKKTCVGFVMETAVHVTQLRTLFQWTTCKLVSNNRG